MPSGTFSCNALSNYPGYVGCNASTIVDLENDTPLRYTYYVLWPFNG